MTYFTDGIHLYEIAAERIVKNYGLVGGIIRYIIIRDCVSEAVCKIDELQLAALSEVRGSLAVAGMSLGEAKRNVSGDQRAA